jgi:hypothetical protein
MILKPSQCLIKSISIKTQKNQVINQDNNFLEFFGSLDIYQNMFNSFMTAELIILDGASFIERHNLSGNEDFEIEFQGYGRDEPMKYKFKIVEQVAISPVNNLRAKQVSFRLVSEEFLTDCSTSISKSYNVGTKEVVTDIVTSFLKSDKKIFIEDTKSIPVIIIPYLSPFKALDFLKQRTVSEKYKSSSFLFFENSDGFNFTTVEGVVDRESKKKVQEFFQSEFLSTNIKSGETSSDIDSHHLFFNHTVSSSFDLVSTFKNGGLKTNVTQYDLTTKKYQSRVFLNDPSTSIFIDSTSNKNPLLSDTVFQQYSQNNSKPLFIPFSKYKDTNNPTTNFIFDTVAERICFSSLFTQKRVYIDIPGNTLLSAGSVINLKVPRYNALNSKKELNEMESGTYLVTACKHSITNADTAKYDTHLELMRIGRGVFET